MLLMYLINEIRIPKISGVRQVIAMLASCDCTEGGLLSVSATLSHLH